MTRPRHLSRASDAAQATSVILLSRNMSPSAEMQYLPFAPLWCVSSMSVMFSKALLRSATAFLTSPRWSLSPAAVRMELDSTEQTGSGTRWYLKDSARLAGKRVVG